MPHPQRGLKLLLKGEALPVPAALLSKRMVPGAVHATVKYRFEGNAPNNTTQGGVGQAGWKAKSLEPQFKISSKG